MKFTEQELAEFKIEAQDLLDGAEKGLLALDQGGAFKCHYDAIFRAFHSIKGAAGMMELDSLQTHMHQLENAFVRNKETQVLGKSCIDFFLRGCDAARSLLDGKKVQFEFPGMMPSQGESARAEGQSPDPQSDTGSSPVPASGLASFCGRVLVIHEDQVISSLRCTLNQARFEVIGSSDPHSIAELLARHAPDVLLSDLKLAKKPGVELLRRVRELTLDLPVIFLSENLTKSELLEVIPGEVFAVLEKPVSNQDLVRVCGDAASRPRSWQLLAKSIELLISQQGDLDGYLKTEGKENTRAHLRREVAALLKQFRELEQQVKKRAA